MSRPENFIDDFKKDHAELLRLITSFKDAIELSKQDKAKEILNRIDALTDGHFNFEKTYLYPRLRRLILEITGNLDNEQETLKNFITESRRTLETNRLNKFRTSNLLKTLPRLSKFFKDCNDLVFLMEKFDGEDKDDLYKRFKEHRSEDGRQG